MFEVCKICTFSPVLSLVASSTMSWSIDTCIYYADNETIEEGEGLISFKC